MATALWRANEDVDGIVERERAHLSMAAFFRTHKTTEHSAEACWLAGNDASGRPVALFQVDRHVPGEISTELWNRFVMYNTEILMFLRGPWGPISMLKVARRGGRWSIIRGACPPP